MSLKSLASEPLSVQREATSRAYLVWAGLGAVFLAVQIYVYAAWILSPDFQTTPVGPDPIPMIVRLVTIGYEITAMLLLVPVSIWFVRGLRRTGKVDTTRALMVGWLTAYWLDPFLNVFRPMFTYNASAVNYGSWAAHIPFWQSAGGARIAEPLFIIGPSYFYSFSTTCLIALWAMKCAEKLWPGLKNVGLTLAGFAGVWFSMELLDVAATRYMGLDAWPGAIRSLSFWPSSFYQFPVYEFLLFPAPFVVCAFLIRSANEDGDTFIERGISWVGAAQWRRNTLRILAFIAFCNLCNLTYTATMAVSSLAADPWPSAVPSWLQDGQCGAFTGLACHP